MLVDTLPPATALLADRGYDADWFREALAERGIAACIPSKINRKVHIPHDRTLYRQRHRIENMFARLKDWRRVHTLRSMRPRIPFCDRIRCQLHLLA